MKEWRGRISGAQSLKGTSIGTESSTEPAPHQLCGRNDYYAQYWWEGPTGLLEATHGEGFSRL